MKAERDTSTAAGPESIGPEIAEIGSSERRTRWLARALWIAAGIGLGYFALGAVLYTARVLGYPIEWDPAEGLARFQLHLLGRGMIGYGDPAELPAFIANYPPLYPLAAWPLRGLLGDGYLALRLVSVAATLGTAILLAVGARRAGAGWRWALLAPWLFLAAPYAGWWLPLARVDSLSLFFLVLAFLVARRPAWAGLALVLAAYTRQTALLGAVGLAAYYLHRREWRSLTIFALVVAVIGGAALAALQLATGGWFWSHVVSFNANRFYPTDVPRYVGGYLGTMAVAVLVTLAAWALPREGRASVSSPLAYLLVPGVLNAVLVGKVGAAVNYFLPLQAGLALTAAVGMARLVALTKDRRGPSWLLGAAALLQMMLWVPHDRRFEGPPPENDLAIARMRGLVEHAGGPVFLERHIGFALDAGRSVPYLPMPFKMLELSGEGVEPGGFHRLVEEQHFELIVVSGEFLDEESQASIREHYSPVETWSIVDSDLTRKEYGVLVPR